jgi:hypothetical protein
MTANAEERRVVAIAEDFGRIAGTVQAKTEGWMDRDALYQEIVPVCVYGAADLLKQLASGANEGLKKKPAAAAGPRKQSGVGRAPSTRLVRNIVSRCPQIRV